MPLKIKSLTDRLPISIGRTDAEIEDALADEFDEQEAEREREQIREDAELLRAQIAANRAKIVSFQDDNKIRDAIRNRKVKIKEPENANQTLALLRDLADTADNRFIMAEREGEFANEVEAMLAQVALSDQRNEFNFRLDQMWADNKLPASAEEVVVGAGFHAAVYCAVRVAQGFPKPVVVERSERVGGTFSITNEATFYLNSRNRPGALGIPGRDEALNVLPGAPIQPSMLSGDEYQRNSDLAFAIRASLAMNAYVVTGFEAGGRSPDEGVQRLYDEGPNAERSILAGRVIYATGLGKAIEAPNVHERILTFPEFMRRMAGPFPLRGMKRVAVIGAGDSGKTAVEALIGQSPSSGYSLPGLDWVESIDWYGVDSQARTKAGWMNCNRSRYKGIASNFPANANGDKYARIDPSLGRANQITGAFDGVAVNGRVYDYAVYCVGFREDRRFDGAFDLLDMGGRNVGRRISSEVYAVGPAAKVPMDSYEVGSLPAQVPENAVALFRYAGRTAQLASELGAPSRERKTRVNGGTRIRREETRTVAYRDSDGRFRSRKVIEKPARKRPTTKREKTTLETAEPRTLPPDTVFRTPDRKDVEFVVVSEGNDGTVRRLSDGKTYVIKNQEFLRASVEVLERGGVG